MYPFLLYKNWIAIISFFSKSSHRVHEIMKFRINSMKNFGLKEFCVYEVCLTSMLQWKRKIQTFNCNWLKHYLWLKMFNLRLVKCGWFLSLKQMCFFSSFLSVHISNQGLHFFLLQTIWLCIMMTNTVAVYI